LYLVYSAVSFFGGWLFFFFSWIRSFFLVLLCFLTEKMIKSNRVFSEEGVWGCKVDRNQQAWQALGTYILRWKTSSTYRLAFTPHSSVSDDFVGGTSSPAEGSRGGGEEVNLQWQGWHKRRFEDHVQIKGTEMRRERERENGGEFKHPHSHFFPRGCFFFILAIVPHFWIKYLSFILVFLFFRKRGVRESEWVGLYRRSSTITERRNRLKNFKNINRIKLQTQRHIIFDGC
jgi:hypothetical protein